jgi:uncharacterized Zn finger protein
MRKKSESNSLKKILTRDTLLEMAGDRYFARGEDYFRQGYVQNLAVDADSVTAYVQGTEAYSVELWVETKNYKLLAPVRWEWTSFSANTVLPWG